MYLFDLGIYMVIFRSQGTVVGLGTRTVDRVSVDEEAGPGGGLDQDGGLECRWVRADWGDGREEAGGARE